jgi:hypothetical protein
MTTEEAEDFYQDFGIPPLTEQQLDTLLANARETNNAALRQLVHQFRLLRSTATALLQHADENYGALIKREVHWERLRFLVHQK